MRQTSILKRISLLSDLPEDELNYLSSALKLVELKEGELLFQEGDEGDSLLAILDGRLDILLGYETKDEQLLASLGSGEFIGEMSLIMPGKARTATARAGSDSRLLKMTRSDFDALLIRQPQMAYSIVQTLTQRLDATNTAAFRDLQEKNEQLQTAYDELRAAQEQIIEKERLERELQVAAAIQASILPMQLPNVDGYSFGAMMKPARMVGGDFFDLFVLDDDHFGIVIGDVADKGVPSAIFMARAHALIMAEARHGGTPGDILRRVNSHLIQLRQSDLFVTVLFGILDLPLHQFDYARAGHELPVLIESDGRVVTMPQLPGQPIGIFDEFLLDEQSHALPPGSTLVLYTDGVTDCCDMGGNTFGKQRMISVLGSQSEKQGEKICDRLADALSLYQEDAPQEDDITIVTIKHQLQSPE